MEGQKEYRMKTDREDVASMSGLSETSAIPEVLPLIPLRDLILFPNLVVPLFVGRERSIKALEEAMRQEHLVALVTQRSAEMQDPEPGDVFEIGTVATVMQELKLPTAPRRRSWRASRGSASPNGSRPTRTSSCASSSSKSRSRQTSKPKR